MSMVDYISKIKEIDDGTIGSINVSMEEKEMVQRSWEGLAQRNNRSTIGILSYLEKMAIL
jgi:hypothetical protein